MKKRDKKALGRSKRKVSPRIAAVYAILRLSVLAVLVRQLVMGNYMNSLLCILTLILFYIPDIAEKTFKVTLPGPLEVVILFFIYGAEILGEIREYYIYIPIWDTLLHTVNGFLMAAIGFAMVDVLNRNKKIKLNLSPFFLAVVAFCFSMTIGVMWEFFEYSCDCLMKTDMQKDAWVEYVSTVSINPEGKNETVRVTPQQIEFTDADGVVYAYENKYLDIGLHDTMRDLLVNALGAFVFSVSGMLYVHGRGKGKLVKAFVPVLKTEQDEENYEDLSKIKKERPE